MTASVYNQQIVLTKHSPAYWRVTFTNPPLNIFGPETLPQLDAVITALETDDQVKVVVFDSATRTRSANSVAAEPMSNRTHRSRSRSRRRPTTPCRG